MDAKERDVQVVSTTGESERADRAVRELLGPGRKVLGVEKKQVVVRETEVVMVNGNPIELSGEEGERIKSCLLSGRLADYPQLLNRLLFKAGLVVVSDALQADSSVNNTVTTRQTVRINDEERVHEATERSVLANSRTIDLANRGGSRVTEPAAAGGGGGGATLEELIHELVPRAHRAPAESFQFAFLLCSRLFVTPTRLLSEFLRRADQLSHMMSPSSHPAFVANLVAVLRRWMASFPTDFREESALQPTKRLARLAVDLHAASETGVNQLLHTLQTHLQAMERHEKQLAALEQRRRSVKTDHDLLSLSERPLTFAQELTRLELEHLCFLGPEELVNSFARNRGGGDPGDRDVLEARQRAATKTRNLDAYVDWFNRLSFLVATTVCKKPKKKLRVKTIEFWIDVARECINFANFNSLMAIITGLNMTPVRRLRRTWLKIQSGKFAALEHQMDPTSNFLSYRSTLKAAVSRSEGATDNVQRVVIPFFSLLVKDLYFVNEGCASRRPDDGRLDVDKFLQLGEKLSEFARWKDVECPYQKVPSVCDFLQLCPILSEELLDFESYECENPELQEEKDRHKMLKHRLKGLDSHQS